jgi:peptidyl-tRNA hydrolase, PTH1 family
MVATKLISLNSPKIRFLSKGFIQLYFHKRNGCIVLLIFKFFGVNLMMWIIVGLGNPGEEYAATRHNVGFMTIDSLQKKNMKSAAFENRFHGFCRKVLIGNQDALLLKPQTFMNRSGTSVQAATAFYKISPERIVVIHDELDLPFGQIKIKRGGGSGGHNGLKDIIRCLGGNFIRIRMGIGKPVIKGTEADYVLGRYRKEELALLDDQIQSAINASQAILNKGAEAAQMEFNRNS